jgi:flagellar protein FliO/FliZ
MESTMDFSTLLLRVIGSLGIVLAVLFAGLYAFKKTGYLPANTAAGNRIRLLARQSLGPRHQLVMVEAADRLLLLGISPEGIRLLSPLGAVSGLSQEIPASAGAGSQQRTFPDILQQMTDGNA